MVSNQCTFVYSRNIYEAPIFAKSLLNVRNHYVKLFFFFLTIAASTLELLSFSMPVCFLLKNEIKWNSVNHRKWSDLLGKSNASCSATKVQTAQYIILSFLEILPLCLTGILSFFKSFYFIPSNLLSPQWSVMERNQALKADSPMIESRILPSVVVWSGA